MNLRGCATGLLTLSLTVFTGSVSASIINGDFETGDFTGWTIFTFDDGAHFGGTGPTAVVLFDTDGDSVSSNAARFQVGQVPPGPIGGGLPRVGGGIFQNFSSGAGIVSIDLDIASSSNGSNADGGLFELLLDGVVVDSVDFMSISAGTVERDTLSVASAVTAGIHELRIRMSRGFGIGSPGQTPNQFVDDVVVNAPSVPEPATLLLLGLGLAGLGFARRRNLSASRVP